MDIDVHQPVPGRLQQHLANWESYGVAESVLRIIREDYSIPLTAWPKRRVFTNNYEPSLESFMQTKLQKFISLGVVEAQPSNTSADLFAHVINPIFAVDKKDGDIRWILDLRYVNKYCTTFKFKLKTLRHIRNLISRGDYLISIDLTKAYYHIRVRKEHRCLLAFRFKNKLYRFISLPMGGSFAPFIFQKVANSVLLILQRELKVVGSVYLDDGIFVFRTKARAASIAPKIVEIYERLGFLVNFPKSCLAPTQVLEHLGFIIDTKAYTLSATQRQQEKIHEQCRQLLRGTTCTLRELAKLPGRLISQQLVIGYVARAMSKNIYSLINNIMASQGLLSSDKKAWNIKTYLDSTNESIAEELQFWLNYQFQPAPLVRDASLLNVRLVVDSSDTATGAFVDGAGSSRKFFHAKLPTTYLPLSSTHRELFGVLNAFRFYAPQFSNRTIIIRTDNQGVFYILGGTDFSGGSNNPTLNFLAKEIINTSLLNNTKLIVQWHRRNVAEAMLADALSKIRDYNDWVLRNSFFDNLNKKYKFTVDFFASSSNTKCPRYYAFYDMPGASGQGLASSWRDEIVYCFPPLPLILFAIRKFINDGAVGILIVPKYTSASWYQLLHRFGYSQLGRLRDCLARGIDLPPDAVMPSPEVQLLAFYLDCR